MDIKYHDGRFFTSPLIGCTGACMYCYLRFDGIKNVVRKNKYSINEIITKITENENFVQGERGSIIAVGAYCDIFPLGRTDYIEHSIKWIKGLLLIGNPVQVISKNILDDYYIEELVENIMFNNQLLYSTTITTFKFHKIIEPNTSSPYDRLKILKSFNSKGIKTNVMIKPFLPNITSAEIENFRDEFLKNNVDYSVVGGFFVESIEMIKSLYTKIGVDETDYEIKDEVLDCSEKTERVIYSDEIESFIDKLKKSIPVFKKSSCVNSNVLKAKNLTNYYELESTYCSKCGGCIYNFA